MSAREYWLVTLTPEKYPCAKRTADGACPSRAVRVRAWSGEDSLDAPTFYGECAGHLSGSRWREFGPSAGAAMADAAELPAAT
jgi:hypothetical protein